MNITAETLSVMINELKIVNTMVKEYLERAENLIKDYVTNNLDVRFCTIALPITKISLEEKTIETDNVYCVPIGKSLDDEYCLEIDGDNVDYSKFSDSCFAFESFVEALENKKFDVRISTISGKIFPLVYVDEEVYKKTD